MRIISGKYKGRHFDVPRNFKARPTTDFAKENLFNILANNVDFEETIALDLFSTSAQGKNHNQRENDKNDFLHSNFLLMFQAYVSS